MNIRLISSIASVALFATGSVAMAQGAGGHHGGMQSPSAGEQGGKTGGGSSGDMDKGGSATGAGHQARGAEGSSAGGREARSGGERAGGRDAAGGKEMGGSKMGASEKGGKSDRSADAGRKGGHESGMSGKSADRESAGRANTDSRAPRHAERGDRGGRDRDTRVSERSDRTNINIRVGGTLPAGRALSPLSADLIRLYPQYRGYRMVVINDETVIVDPSSRRIVKTVTEGRSVGMSRRSTECR